MSKFSIPFYNQVLISEGCYEVLIKDMQLGTNKFNQKEQIRVIFEFLDPGSPDKSDKKATISAYYTKTLHPTGNLVAKFIKPLLGDIPTEEESGSSEFELDQFLGKKCEIQIVHHIKEDCEIIAVVNQVIRQLL